MYCRGLDKIALGTGPLTPTRLTQHADCNLLLGRPLYKMPAVPSTLLFPGRNLLVAPVSLPGMWLMFIPLSCMLCHCLATSNDQCVRSLQSPTQRRPTRNAEMDI